MRAVAEIDNRIVAAAQGRLRPGRGVRTGTLRRDIQAQPPRVEPGRVVGVVGTGTASKGYAIIIHKGRGPVTAKNKRFLRIVLADGNVLYRKRVGPAKAIPFMAEGMQQVRPKISDIVRKHLKKAIQP